MKAIIKTFKSFSWQIWVLIFFICIIGIPSLFVNWMIIDDGVDLLIGKNMQHYLATFDFNGLWGIFLEKETGRFRPAYWLYMWLTYLIGGYNPFLHHLINFLVCSVSAIFIYLTIKILTSSKTAALIGGLIFVLAPINLENWYRLGPVEPKIVLFLSVSTYFLVRICTTILADKKISKTELLCLFLPTPFIFFLKETSFIIIPYYLFILFGVFLCKKPSQKKKWLKIFGWLFLINFIVGVASLLLNTVVRTSGSYSAYYKVALPNIFSTGRYYLKILAESYGIILYGLLITFIFGLYSAIKKKILEINLFFEISFLIGFFMLYIILTPWLIPMGRYLEPSLFFFSLFMGLQASRFMSMKLSVINLSIFKMKVFLSPRQIKKWFFLLGFIFLILKYLFPTLNYIEDRIIGQKNTAIMFQSLSEKAPQNSRVFWNLIEREGTVELIMEANILLNLVYDRPDLSVFYLNKDDEGSIKKGDLIFSALVDIGDKIYDDEYFINNKKYIILKSFTHEFKRIYIHPKGSVDVLKAIFFNRPVPLRTFFEKDVFKPQWYIYQAVN